MTRPLFDSEYIFGIYEPGGEQLMLEAGRPGWIVFSETIGHDPADRTGVDFSSYSAQGLGVICRISNGYEPDGTIPHSSQYEAFARRVANFVGTSRGCKIWVLGNEMNYAAERPGIVIDWSRHQTRRDGPPEEADPTRRGVKVRFNALPDYSTEIRTTRGAIVSPGEVITPELYARCYSLCRDAIHRVPGHEDDQVLVGAVAPWNTQTIYPGNSNGDWVRYFQDILTLLGSDGCDGFALHAYTHGADPGLISSDARLGPPFQQRHAEFRCFMDFMEVVPEQMRHLPAYITETDQTSPWRNENRRWVQRAYAEINTWNQQPDAQQIRALALYRWPRIDRWYIEGKKGVIADFNAALANNYRWRAPKAESPQASVEDVAAPPPPRKERRRSAPPAPYQVEWLDDRFPPKLLVDRTVTATITLRNAGALTWSWGGGNPFRLGYHYYRNRRRLELPPDKDLRTDVPQDVEPGETITVELQVALPSEPGNYTLEIDLVHEGVSWFKEKGSPVLTRWLTVEAESPATGADGNGSGPNLPVPLFNDVAGDLPRSGTAYARRSLDQIRYLVISHTGTNPRLSLERIAQAHVQHGYPGIAYDFVVDGQGQVYKVSDIEDVAEPGQAWSLQGVNIGLSGNFSSAPPPLPQLDAAGRLCAWLARNLGLEADAIVGMGELVRTESPGRTFYRGPTWQQTLQRQVRLHLAVLSSGAGEHQAAEQGEQVDALQAEIRNLEAALQAAQAEQQRMQRVNERLQAELSDFKQQIRATAAAPSEQRPAIEPVINQLPRDASRYRLRQAEDVAYVVINHTGAAPGVSLTRLAEAHMPDWPGILYDFFIDEHGRIQQTQPLDEVAQTEQPYIAKAVNVAFAGRFDDEIPTREQIFAGGRLIAWLLQRFPHLEIESIKGVSEFIRHESPGRQWLDGARWKESLIASVRRAAGLVDPTETERALQQQLDETTRKLQLVEHNAAQLEEQRLRLQEENQALQERLAEQTASGRQYIVPQPPVRTIIDQLAHHPTLRYERRARSQITHIAVHHTATSPTIGPARIAELHVGSDAARGKEPWPGIGYHFFIHADGAIDQTNLLETVSYHVYQHDSYTVGVVFAGSFMNGHTPTSAQVRAGAHLIAWLMQELKVPLARVWGHREYPDNITVCPGSEWTGGARWRDALFAAIEEIRSGVGIKGIRHYMLFWQRPHPGPLARQDFINAVGYVARFRPTVGFSVDDARQAEFVTVVGGEAGISAEQVKLLRASGCKVERIAGRTEEETGAMLAELVRTGRRFRSFDVDF